ncbi:ABC transporter ATP-binding protein [Streptomyces prasinus]|uniref:ABC transporter ATP-binding protein n=1 Tax=Streptomyces prasinus TaxID=67345 RepID=UPI0006EB7656|nr:ABC transporter ATP-binding protein [Streptomyces prasinus]
MKTVIRRASPAVRRIGSAARLSISAAPHLLCVHIAMAVVAALLPVAMAWLTKLTLDGLSEGSSLRQAVAPAAVLAVGGLIAGILPHASSYVRSCMERQVGLHAQTRLFEAVGRIIGLGPFEDPTFLDRLNLAKQAGGRAPLQVVDGFIGASKSVVTMAAFVGSLSVVSPELSVFVVLFGFPVVFAELLLARKRTAMMWGISPTERREFFYNQLLSNVDAAKEIRLYSLGRFLRNRMLDDRRLINSAREKMDRHTFRVQAGLGLMAALVAGAGLLWAVRAAGSGRLTLGDITMLVAAIAAVQSGLAQFAAQTAVAHEALVMFGHYETVTHAEPDLVVQAAPRAIAPLISGIELHDVWFRYSEDDDWVLRGVNLSIGAGKSVAVVGLNGAGKSTLVKLLCRFYDPTRGRILWDGIDLRDIDVDELRSRMGAVFQDFMHYDMTAGENIALGDLSALGDPARLHEAAEHAGIHRKLASLPRGYDTLLSRTFYLESEKGVEDSGVLLSGGQWQRVALARVFLRSDRDFLILDEPTSGLDPEAEYEFHSALKALREGRTSLVISHRLGTVRIADHIVVLAQGKVTESGSHEELMSRENVYAKLFRAQAAGYTPQPGVAVVRTREAS